MWHSLALPVQHWLQTLLETSSSISRPSLVMLVVLLLLRARVRCKPGSAAGQIRQVKVKQTTTCVAQLLSSSHWFVSSNSHSVLALRMGAIMERVEYLENAPMHEIKMMY